jgi:hypothetical protein
MHCFFFWQKQVVSAMHMLRSFPSMPLVWLLALAAPASGLLKVLDFGLRIASSKFSIGSAQEAIELIIVRETKMNSLLEGVSFAFVFFFARWRELHVAC